MRIPETSGDTAAVPKAEARLEAQKRSSNRSLN